MDSSLRKNIILKRIFYYLHRTPNIHCVRCTGENLFFYRRGTELLNCNIELQQCLQSSNDGKAILFLFDGILAGRRDQVPCRNFFEFTVASYPSKINVTGKPLARYTFCESFPKKALGLQNLIWKIRIRVWIHGIPDLFFDFARKKKQKKPRNFAIKKPRTPSPLCTGSCSLKNQLQPSVYI